MGFLRLIPGRDGGRVIEFDNDYGVGRVVWDDRAELVECRLEIRDPSRPTRARPEPTPPAPQVVRWMGVRWYGTPAPKRVPRAVARAVRLLWMSRRHLWGDGCGCAKRLKDASRRRRAPG